MGKHQATAERTVSTEDRIEPTNDRAAALAGFGGVTVTVVCNVTVLATV